MSLQYKCYRFELKTFQSMKYYPSLSTYAKYEAIISRHGKLDGNKGREMYKSRCSKSDFNSFAHTFHASRRSTEIIIYLLHARRAKISPYMFGEMRSQWQDSGTTKIIIALTHFLKSLKRRSKFNFPELLAHFKIILSSS